MIAYKLGCSRAKTQGDKAIFLKKGYYKKNSEFTKPTLTTYSHILFNNCGYTAYICDFNRKKVHCPLGICHKALLIQKDEKQCPGISV